MINAFTIFRQILCIILIHSLLWPDVVKCMEDEEPFSQPFQKERTHNVSLKEDELQDVSLTPSQSDNEGDYTDEKTPLLGNIKIPEDIEGVESSCWGWFNYRNIKNSLFKLISPFFTNKHALDEKEKKKCTPLSMWGGSFPLKEQIKRNRTLKIGGSAIEDFLVEFTKTSLLGFIGYELYELIKSSKSILSRSFIENFYTALKKFDYYRMMIQTVYYHPVLFTFIAVPLGFAVIKAIGNLSQISKSTKDTIEKRIQNINLKSEKWDSRFFSVLSVVPTLKLSLIFHPSKRNIRALTSSIQWEGHLSPETRLKALNTLIDLATNRKGVTQMTAIEGLVDLVHGLHLKDLKRSPHKEALLKIKVDAYNALKQIYEKLPRLSFNKIKTAILLWEIGYSPSKKTSVLMPILKAIELGIYGGFLYGIGFFLYKYITCSVKYLNQFLWMNDFQPYVSPYDRPCYGIQEKGFNTLPHQTAETLIGNLKQYGFPNNLYDSDLSGKHIKGEVLANITQEFVRQKKTVSLNSLNIGNNAVTNSSHVQQIFAALPEEITSLDATNMGGISYAPYSPASFSNLGRLKNLRTLILSYNRFTPTDNSVLAEVVKDLNYLQELRIASVSTNLSALSQNLPHSLEILDLRGCDLSNAGDQIALGKALKQNLTLRKLYLGSTGIGASFEGNKELADGFSAQTQLTDFDISGNSLESSSNGNSSTLLSSFPPSIINLDVSNNAIGILSDSLAQSVQKMEGLTSFKAANNDLGDSPNLLNALHDKKNLTFLDFYQNNLQNPFQISNLLQTLPSLEELDFSNNLLTNGTVLAVSFRSLPNLKKLKLVGNSFITSDRIAIWNATSFLSKSPFYLDEDLTYTSYYLNSLNPQTTSLDFSGLIQNNATALESIMQQVANRFVDLEELDLSEDAIGNSDSETNTPKGIQALTTYLAQLKNLKSLKIKDCYGSITPEVETYFKNFSYTIGQLANISILDLSGTNLFYAKDLGNGLKESHNLTSVKLDRCWIGPSVSQWQGGVELFEGLTSHSNLTHLSASLNPIGINSLGKADPNSTLVLANALSSWSQLRNLVLPYTHIGYNDTNSLDVFLQKLGELALTINKPGKSLEVNLLNGIYNSTWSKEVDAFRKLMNQSVIDNCARQLCTGKPFTQSAKEKHRDSVNKNKILQEELSIKPAANPPNLQDVRNTEPVTSGASRLAPFYEGTINYVRSWFSLKSWSTWGNGALDSVANGILSYSKHVVESAPVYFSGRLDSSKSLTEGSNKAFYNYPLPHFRAISQGEHHDVHRYIQALPQSQGFNCTSSLPMISGGFQPSMLPN
jgi:Ran GTPase-activating protein (RanGAP) involved in mRNA processing and transport